MAFFSKCKAFLFLLLVVHSSLLCATASLSFNFVSRSTWWSDEHKEATLRKRVNVGTKRRPRYKYVSTQAPSKDMCGYCNRYWGCDNGAKVEGYREIVWHHTDGVESPNLVMMALEHKAQNFCDIGYHIVIKRNKQGHWAAYQGTPFGFVGSHAGGYNFLKGTREATLGIVVAGDYGNKKPDADLVRFMTKVQDYVVNRFSIKDIRSHRDGPMAVNDGSDCPGKYMVPTIQMLRDRL